MHFTIRHTAVTIQSTVFDLTPGIKSWFRARRLFSHDNLLCATQISPLYTCLINLQDLYSENQSPTKTNKPHLISPGNTSSSSAREMDPERATPCASPSYKIYLSDEAIKSIICRSLPDVKEDQITIEQLGSGKSFNNRIYYVDLSQPTSICRPTWNGDGVDISRNPKREQISSLVLKVAGFPFGGAKIQNELACLLLLEKYCPSIPTPELVAWSEDGRRIKTPIDTRGSRERSLSVPTQLKTLSIDDDSTSAREETADQGWLLMTRAPGRTITHADLSGAQGASIMHQIAEHVATWRHALPATRTVGNMRLIGRNSIPPASATLYDKAILPGLDVYIDGIITKPTSPSPLKTYLEYITHILRANLRTLKNCKLLQRNEERVNAIVRQFIKDTLSKLSLLHGKSKAANMVFTHYDISPRNVLVSPVGHVHGDAANSNSNVAVAVSAVIDFEFAGFYPAAEEFTHTVENSHSEWTVPLFGEFLSELDRREALPACLAEHISSESEPMDGVEVEFGQDEHIPFGGPDFHQAVLLHRVAANIAPWWIKEESELSEDELKSELDGAKMRIENAVKMLGKMVEKK
ncbi:hypothetical protein LTR47_007141 [Exophiala xenobiotica]|nr:hypothetical protein LTR47_007141 [Exophiala xenobiotica]KAK5245995.1 hypothetical protein LTS06_008668 [Exophiala xenobiotica]KAK5348232.1 hypothetical protein LTR61_008090 [Exophiala xenobiotica]KAK5362730.1 hypothetical protein LTR11_009420 [Exophiala xenobiotica]KAK5366037.1 hypothetical protein LTS03_008796 [Exophiala xenobiotica]